MKEALEFILGDFWRFIGILILTALVFNGTGAIIEIIIRGFRK